MAHKATDLPPLVLAPHPGRVQIPWAGSEFHADGTPRTITERLCDFMIDTATGKSWTEIGRTFESYKESLT